MKSKNNYLKMEISVPYYIGEWLKTVLRWVFLLFISFVILYPLLHMVSMAFRSPEDFRDVTVIWIPKHLTWFNMKTAVFDIQLLDSMKNTLILSIGSTALLIMSTCLAGYGFARYRFKGNTFLFLVMIFTILIPSQMLNMPNYLIFRDFDFFGIIETIFGGKLTINMIDTYWAYFIPAALGQGMKSGIFILVFRQFFVGMPTELEEAAQIDGCGQGRTFLSVMLPNATTPMLVFSLFSLVWYWSDYYMAYTYLSNTRMLATRLIDLRSELYNILPRFMQTNDYIIPIEQAACLFSILPLIILFIVAQKYFVQGIDRTGIVG